MVEIQLLLLIPKLLLPGFYKAFSHHHFVVNPFSSGHVPFPCNHCQMENRTNRKSNRGPNGNKVQHANCNGQPVFDKKLTVQPQQITVHINLLLRRTVKAILDSKVLELPL